MGRIVTVVGNGISSFGGDGCRAVAARLPNPNQVAVDAAGNLYIGDAVANRIRRVWV